MLRTNAPIKTSDGLWEVVETAPGAYRWRDFWDLLHPNEFAVYCYGKQYKNTWNCERCGQWVPQLQTKEACQHIKAIMEAAK